MSEELAAVAYALYRSLRTMPCNCRGIWKQNRWVPTEQCRRCKALQDYETLCPDQKFERVPNLETP